MSSAFANAGLPENFAFFIWIERVNDARLLASEEKIASLVSH